jgi:hypothetical protein
MTRRSRIVGFGSAALLVVAGAVCAAVFSPGLGEDLALVLISLGAVLAVSLVFLEVGFSEDRERAREEAARRLQEEKQRSPRPSARPGRPHLDQTRGRPRRLR